jgi:hypothetical protein
MCYESYWSTNRMDIGSAATNTPYHYEFTHSSYILSKSP